MICIDDIGGEFIEILTVEDRQDKSQVARRGSQLFVFLVQADLHPPVPEEGCRGIWYPLTGFGENVPYEVYYLLTHHEL